MPEEMDIVGPAGAIETMLERAADAGSRFAVLCHPHPLYGGSMHDAVLDTAAAVLLRRGINVVRFNFRGVGASEGHHGSGIGEVEDLVAVLAWLTRNHAPSSIVLGGYSFGSAIAWRTAPAAVGLERVLLIAPPVGRMPFDSPAPACPVHVVHGDEDEFIDPDALAAWPGVARHPVPGANHFFMGRWPALASAIDEALD